MSIFDLLWFWYYKRRSVNYDLPAFERNIAKRRADMIRSEYKLRKFREQHQEVYSDL